MIDRIVNFAIRNRWLVMAAVFGFAVFGYAQYQRLPIDAVPDITNVQVQINTQAPGYSPLETEQRVTFLVETAMAGLPKLESTRSISAYGLSQVTVVFEDGTDIYFARQLVNERLQEVKGQLPAGVEPEMGPVSTGLGEIYMYSVAAEPDARKPDGTAYTPTDLREHPGLDHPSRNCARCRAYRKSTASAATPSSTRWRPIRRACSPMA